MINEMKNLIEILNKLNYEYYVLDNPTMADSQYDKLYDRLRFLEEQTNTVLDNSPSRRVGGEVISAFKKHKHINQLYSLDKSLTVEQMQAFENRIRKLTDKPFSYTVEYKFDGLTICLTYDNGKFIRGTTRGNGVVGEDVTAQVLTIKTFPLEIDYKGVLEVQGEAIMKLSVLEEYNKTADEPLKNARNAVAGAIRNLDSSVTQKRKLEILFYNVNYMSEGSLDSQEDIFNFLNKNNFKTFNYFKKCNNIAEVMVEISYIDKTRGSLDVLTDGAVVKVNEKIVRDDLGSTQKFPRWAMAYKFEAEETTTIVKDVIWQVGRTGKLTPLALLEPVELCGVTVKRATLNNYGDIERKDVKINSRVLIRRSNEVIPEILGTTEHYKNSKDIVKPTICPYCKSEVEQVGAHIFCTNKDCTPRIINKLANFAQKDCMNIDGFSEMTITQLYENVNLRTYSQLYQLTEEVLINLDKVQAKKAKNIIEAIENSKSCSLENFIFALGIDGIGKKTAKDLAKKFKSIQALSKATYENLIEMNDIGDVMASDIVSYFNDQSNIEEIEKLLSLGVKPIYHENIIGNIFAGEKVVLTGTLTSIKRSQAGKEIESRGGQIMSSVSKLTTLVVAGEQAGSKLAKAEQLKIKIIDEKQFINMLNS